MSEPDCIFCTLISGRAPVSIIESDEHVVAFLDAFPVAPGHVLVSPRRHVETLSELSQDEGAAVFACAQRVAGRVRDRLAPAANLHLSDGVEADQDVPHVHLHVIPRHAGDQVVLDLPGERADRAQLDAVAATLASSR